MSSDEKPAVDSAAQDGENIVAAESVERDVEAGAGELDKLSDSVVEGDSQDSSEAGGFGEGQVPVPESSEELDDEEWDGNAWDEDEGDEDAAPLEEFVEEAPEVADDTEMRWYILKVQVNREDSICDALRRRVKIAGMESYFGDILVPTEDVREFTKSGRQRIVKRKLYPGYVVVRMLINDDSWFLVRETPGIGDFTGAVGKPAPLTDSEIDRIVASSKKEEADEASDEIKTTIRYKTGDRVRVKEGYFQNHEGEISAIDERNGRITVMINIFGRPNPVELDHWHVEDI